MKDSRIDLLAKRICENAVKVTPGDNVSINLSDVPSEMACALIKQVNLMGGNPFVTITDSKVSRLLSIENSVTYWEDWSSLEMQKIQKMQCYIAIRGGDNEFEGSDIPQAQTKLIRSITRPVINERVNNTRWCILKWPTSGMSQLNEMSTEAFEDFYFNVCTYDYSKMAAPAEALRQRLLKTDKVRLVANGTDISFSIKGLPAISCTGTHNIPDGEVFTAPVKDSVNGVISYNTKTKYDGVPFNNIKLTVENGKIISWDGPNKLKLDEIFNSDEGARYFGEFAIGINPFVTKATGNILFDEKITGSIHLTPGSSYDDCNNGNKSSIHWDLVLIQTPEFGGGQIYFDNELVRDNGLFVVDDLKCCNPEELNGENEINNELAPPALKECYFPIEEYTSEQIANGWINLLDNKKQSVGILYWCNENYPFIRKRLSIKTFEDVLNVVESSRNEPGFLGFSKEIEEFIK